MAAAGCGRFGRRTSTPARAAARAAAGTAEAAAARTTTSCGCGSGRAQQRAVAFDCGRCSPWGDAESNARWLLIAGQGRDKLHPPRCREALSAYHRLAPRGRASTPPLGSSPLPPPPPRKCPPPPRPPNARPPLPEPTPFSRTARLLLKSGSAGSLRLLGRRGLPNFGLPHQLQSDILSPPRPPLCQAEGRCLALLIFLLRAVISPSSPSSLAALPLPPVRPEFPSLLRVASTQVRPPSHTRARVAQS